MKPFVIVVALAAASCAQTNSQSPSFGSPYSPEQVEQMAKLATAQVLEAMDFNKICPFQICMRDKKDEDFCKIRQYDATYINECATFRNSLGIDREYKPKSRKSTGKKRRSGMGKQKRNKNPTQRCISKCTALVRKQCHYSMHKNHKKCGDARIRAQCEKDCHSGSKD